MNGQEPQQPSGKQGVLEKVRFVLERLMLRGVRYRLLIAAMIIGGVAVIAGLLIALFDPTDFTGVGDAIWWAFLRLTDPGYLGDDEGLTRRGISTVVTVLGYVLFLGMLVAILTQWLNDTLTRLQSGTSRVAITDHVILLGWTRRSVAIVEQLLLTRGRVDRFLANRDARTLRIVIMAEHVDDALIQELREHLGSLWNDKQVLLRSGSPLRIDHLERVAFRDAAAVILPGAEFGEENPEAVDAETIKTLMSVSASARAKGTVPPLAIAALFDVRKAEVAHRAYAGDSEIVAADDIISRILAQSVRIRGLCTVFLELLTSFVGNGIYLRTFDGDSGTEFGSLIGAYPKAVVLGTVRAQDGESVLNPPRDTPLEPGDLLVLIARNYGDCVRAANDRARLTAPSGRVVRAPDEHGRRLLIVGWNRKLPSLLQEFERYGADAFHIDVVSARSVEAREAMLKRSCTGTLTHVRHIEANYTTPGVLESLDLQGYDNIVLMASEASGGADEADANTIYSTLLLRGVLPADGAGADVPDLLVELMDDDNLFLFEGAAEDVIVSPQLVSYVLSQVALRRELAAVFEELSRPWGAQILILPARGHVPGDAPVRFTDLEDVAAAQGEIALGVWCASGPDAGLALNPDREKTWTFSADDKVVVLATYAEPEPLA